MRESDGSTGARGQGSAPVDGTTAGSSDGLAGHNGEDAASRTHEGTVVERAGVAREESNLGEVAIVEEVAAVEVPMT